MGLLFISLYNTYSFGKYNSTMLKRTLLILQLSAWCCMKVLLQMLLASVTAGMSRRNLYTPLYTRRSTLYPSPSRLHLEAWRTRALIMCLRKSFHEWNLPPRRKTSLRIDSYSLSAAYFQYSIFIFPLWISYRLQAILCGREIFQQTVVLLCWLVIWHSSKSE